MLRLVVNTQPPDPSVLDCDAVTLVPDGVSTTNLVEVSVPDDRVIGQYVVTEEIARGGMGIVYRARHRHLGRKVAIKTLLLSGDEDKSAAERFAVEAEAVARLDHPGIVTIYEVGQHDGQPFLAMKLIEGGSLSQRLQQGPLDCKRALEIAIEVSEAIAHAHQRGVIHRDLKPANILLDQDGHAVVTDFGVAKCVENARCQLTTAGEPIGTPHYMPPEQADANRGVVGPASDVYSIGALIYAMLTGRPPFQAASAIDVMLQVLANDPVPPKQLNSTVPVTLEAIVLKCLQKESKRRYQSAMELAGDLCNFRDGKPTIAKPIRGMRWVLYNLRKHFMVATVSGSVVTLLLLTTFVVVIAHVKLLNQAAELEAEKADLADVLMSERRMFQLRVSGLKNETISESEFAAERLASYAGYIEKQNPQLATRLAVESIRLSQAESRPEQRSAVEVLRRYRANQLAQPGQDNVDALATSDFEITEIVAEVDKTLTYQLTPEQRVLFGIETTAASLQATP